MSVSESLSKDETMKIFPTLFKNKNLLKDKNCRLAIQLSLLILLFIIVYLFLMLSRLPLQVPLFYSRPWGEEQLADRFFLFFLPGGLLLILFINWQLASLLWLKETLLAKILLWLNVLISLLTGVTLIKIIGLVT